MSMNDLDSHPALEDRKDNGDGKSSNSPKCGGMCCSEIVVADPVCIAKRSDVDTAIGKGFTAQMRRGLNQAGMKTSLEPPKVVTRGDDACPATTQSVPEACMPHHTPPKESASKTRGPTPAPEYEAVPGDELDQKVELYARRLTSDAGRHLMIHRLTKGEYQIANQKVYLSWSRGLHLQNPAQGPGQWKDSSDAEVFVQEDDTVTPILEPLSTYLEHAANINYELKNGKAVTRLPAEMRLSFNEVGTHVMDGDEGLRLLAMKMALGQAERRERAALEWTKSNNITGSRARSASASVDPGSCHPLSPVHKCSSYVSPATVTGANAKNGMAMAEKTASLPPRLPAGSDQEAFAKKGMVMPEKAASPPQLPVGSNQEAFAKKGLVMPEKAASLPPRLKVSSSQGALQIRRTGFRSRSVQAPIIPQSQQTRASSPWVVPQVGFQQQSDSSVAQGGLRSSRVSSLSQQPHVTRRQDICFQQHWRSSGLLPTPLRRNMGSLRATTTMMLPALAPQCDSFSKSVFSPNLGTRAMRAEVTPSTCGMVVTDCSETIPSLSCPRRQHLIPTPTIFPKCSSEEPLKVQVQPQMVMCAR